MKKIVFIILLFICIISIGCKDKTSVLDRYKDVVNESLENDIQELIYEKTQIYENEEIYKKKVETKIESYNDNKGIVIYYEKSLNEFDLDNKYKEVSYTKEYNKDTEKLEKLSLSIDLSNILIEDNDINYKENKDKLTLSIENNKVKDIFDIEATNFILDLIISNQVLSEVRISFESGNSIFTISYLIKF